MSLTFQELRNANLVRCESAFHPLDDWSLTDWACAMAGEAGEACNLAKKIRRGDFTLEAGRDSLAAELADVVLYADMLAARAGIDLSEAVRWKFNAVSARVGSPIRLVEGA